MNNRTDGQCRAVVTVIATWLLILSLLFILLESLFFCCVVSLFPYATRVDMGFGIYPLLQEGSSGSTAPQHYTGIFGDSYAFGSGDWFLEVQDERNPVFNIAQLLHQHSGRDVISFGIPGSSNLCGWIEDPVSALHYINAGKRYTLPDPETILLFFYEGNDILETDMDYQSRFLGAGYDPARMNDREYFRHFIETEMLARNRYYRSMQQHPWLENIYLPRFVANIIESARDTDGTKAFIRKAIADLRRQPPPAGSNRAVIAGKNVSLPDNMGGPPVEMDPVTVDNALLFINSITGYVRQRFQDSHIVIVYIPSPAMSYDITSDDLSLYRSQAGQRFPLITIRENSNTLCQRLQDIARQNRISFLDTRPGMRKKGQQEMLHGIADTGHLDEAGYRALTEEIATFLDPWERAGYPQQLTDCARL